MPEITTAWQALKMIAAVVSLSFGVGAFAMFLYLSIVDPQVYFIAPTIFFGASLGAKASEFIYKLVQERKRVLLTKEKEAVARSRYIHSLIHAYEAQPEVNRRRLLETRRRGEVSIEASWYGRDHERVDMAMLSRCPLLVQETQAVVDDKVIAATYTITPDGCAVIDERIAAMDAGKRSNPPTGH